MLYKQLGQDKAGIMYNYCMNALLIQTFFFLILRFQQFYMGFIFKQKRVINKQYIANLQYLNTSNLSCTSSVTDFEKSYC